MTSLSRLDPCERAKRHAIARERPAVNFFEGALLGNGGLGAVVTTRPDSILIHFGHNNVWDIRIAEDHADEIGTFREIFERVKAIPREYPSLEDDAWYKEYYAMTQENYSKPYPRPFPCGSLLLGFDRRETELLGHRLDISTGVCEVFLLIRGKLSGQRAVLQIFTDMMADRLWLRLTDEAGQPIDSPFNRVRLIPDPATPAELPQWTALTEETTDVLSFRQVLPFQVPELYDPNAGHPKDKAFRLTARLNAQQLEEIGPLERSIEPAGAGEFFVSCVQLDEGLASAIIEAAGEVPLPTNESFESASAGSLTSWQEYWRKSGVALDDEILERTWYRNLYFFNCAVRAGVTCPGLFANWSYQNIGTAWHGDYHMNYNTQQPFWMTFSSNHVDKHLPYVDMVDHLRPVSRKWAREYYGLRGAYFPHSAYPVEMNLLPYPVPTWGWEICETPWTVQSLWWHYLYTQDGQFLKERAFEPIKEAVLFMVDYMTRPEAHGPAWNDEYYHIFPTVPPELYGLQPGFDKNHDCLVDLTLTKFVFRAYLEACRVLRCEENEGDLIEQTRDILQHFPPHPTAISQCGEVFVSVIGEDPETVYNVPNSPMPVFPGEEYGLHSPPEEYEIAANTYRNHRNEGGNEMVFLNLQGARLGLLDLDRFKRQIEYCTLPNGTCADMVLQVHGRYSDTTPYDFMAPMGIWFENFGLPVVINECLLQSYNGTLRLFPNWPEGKTEGKSAEFRTLRAAGAFLVSASYDKGTVQWIEITSEAGAPLRLLNPWPNGVRWVTDGREQILHGAIIERDTVPGETIHLTQALPPPSRD